MDFSILGSLEVRHDDTVIPVRGRQQPKVLAMLLLQAGQVVPVDRLVDALWDDDPPTTARRQVQNTVAALRRTLSVAQRSPITAVGEGYRLATDDLDAHRFAAIVKQGLADAEANRLAEAHTRLCQALELWRGPVLEGMNGRVLRAYAEQLDEARLRAFETRMDIELRLGQPGRIVVEARRLLTEHPYRQETAGLLMRALHQCDRGTEAVEVFAALRTRLGEELGIDPSRALRELHQRILSPDTADTEPVTDIPTATTPGTPTASAAVAAPAQLPATVAGFTGRHRQFTQLDALLASTPESAVLATIAGTGGIGKTALAVQWARHHADHFPDGQLFVDLHGYDHGAPLTPADVLTRFLRALGLSPEAIPTELDTAAALYRSVLHGRRVLVLLDNAATVEQVRPLLPASPGCFTLVTSRDSLGGLTAIDGAHRIGVGILDPTEALDLLSDLIGQSRLAAEATDAARIVELCGRLPLALRVVGANLAARPDDRLADVAAELAGADRLDRLVVLGGDRAAVADSITVSLMDLDERTRGFFDHLGMIPGAELATGLAAAVADVSETEARRCFARLGRAHLVDPIGEDRWRFHDLVRLYARTRAETGLSPHDRAAVADRLLDYLEVSRYRIPHEDRLAIFKLWRDNPKVWKAFIGFDASIHDGYDPDAIRRMVTVGLEHAEVTGDVRGQAFMHNLIAGTYWAARRLPEAVAAGTPALETARESGDQLLIGRHLANMGTFRAMSGDTVGAKEILEEALRVAEATGSAEAVSARLDTVGDIHTRLGHYAEAEKHLLRSEALQPGGVAGERWVRNTNRRLATLYLDTGRYTEGLRRVDAVLAMPGQGEIGRPQMLCLRGALRLADGDPTAALADFEAAIGDDARNRFVGESVDSLLSYALCLSRLGDHRAALDQARECLDIGRTRGLPRPEAAACLALAEIHDRLGEPDLALDFAERARALYRKFAEPLRHGRSLVALYRANTALGRTTTAARHRQAAESIFEDLGVARFEKF